MWRGVVIRGQAILPETGLKKISRRGYHLIHWTTGGMNFWVVSDVNEQTTVRAADTRLYLPTSPSRWFAAREGNRLERALAELCFTSDRQTT